MALLNIFKKKQKKEAVWKEQRKEREDRRQPKERANVVVKETGRQHVQEEREGEQRKGRSLIAWRVLQKPHVTEKASMLAEKNQYVFQVARMTNKHEVKRAVEDVYGVKVIAVRISQIPRKRRMRGRREGWKKGYKKAIVKIAKGQKIEILPR